MQLREWQRTFQGAVLGALPVDTVPLRGDGRLPRELSVGIYANAYRERLHEALRDNFPALHRLLGDDDFAALAYAFIAVQPPRTASIRWFGALLPEYLHETEPYASCRVMAELAEFEWALRHTVDAADGNGLSAEYLQELTAEQWESLRCGLQPALTILRFSWNAPQVWRALDADEAPPPPTALDSCWLVYRSADLSCAWRSADALEVQCLESWERGDNFGELCECIAAQSGEPETAVATAATFMRTWVEQELLIHAAPSTPISE